MEKSRQVDTFEVNLYCDSCGGEMNRIAPDVVLTTYPPQYTYICSKCGREFTTSKAYPYIRYVVREESDGNL